MNEQEWLEQRRKVVTATDVPILLGVSQYKSPLQLWAEKVEGEEQAQSTAMEVGLDLQPVLIRKAAKLTKWHTEEVDLDRAWRVKDFIGATIDGLITIPQEKELREYGLGIIGYDGDVEPCEAILECKTTGRLEDDALPPAWFAQVQTQMYVHDRQGAVVITLILDYRRRYRLWLVRRDDQFIERIIQPAAQEFYQCLVQRTPPRASSAIDLPITRSMYTRADNVIESSAYDDMLNRYAMLQSQCAEIRERLRAVEDEMRGIEAQLWQCAGESHASRIVGTQYTVAFHVSQRSEYVVPAQEIKRMTIKENR